MDLQTLLEELKNPSLKLPHIAKRAARIIETLEPGIKKILEFETMQKNLINGDSEETISHSGFHARFLLERVDGILKELEPREKESTDNA